MAHDVYTLCVMARKRYSFWIDAEQADGLKAVKDRDGVPESVQIRRALNEWLQNRGVMKPIKARKGGRSKK